MPDVDESISRDADAMLLRELRNVTPAQFDEVLQQLMIEIRLEPRKVRNKPAYYYAETISMQDQNRVILFVTKRDGMVGITDVESLANHADKVRAPRCLLISMGEISSDAERSGHSRGVQLIDGSEFAALIRKSGIEDMILKDFAEEVAMAPQPGEEVSLEGQMMLGVELLQAGEFMRALDHFDQAIASDPNSEMAWRFKGEVLDQLGHHGKALECFSRAIEIDPANAETWYAIGMSMYALGRYTEELQSYHKALKINPKMEKALVNRGATLLKMRRYEEAMESFDRALKLNYRLIKVHNNRGIALKHLNRLEEALESFDSALGLDSDFADAWLNKGTLMLQLGRLDEALEALDHVVSLRPGTSQAWIIKGEIESRLGKIRESIKNYEKAIELDPTNMEIKKALDHEKSKIHKEQADISTRISSIFGREAMKTEAAPPPIMPRERPEPEMDEEEVTIIKPEDLLAEESTESVEPIEKETPAELPEEVEEVIPIEEFVPATERAGSEVEEEPEEVEPAEEAEEQISLPLMPEEDIFEDEFGEPPMGVAEEVFGDAAELMLQMRRPEVALEELDKGLRLEPMSARMFILRGKAYYSMNRLDEAIDAFRRASKLDSASEEALYSLEYLFNQKGLYDDAKDALHPLLDGRHWIAELLAAMNCDHSGKIKELSEHMEAAVSMEPSAIAWNYKGLLDLDQGDFESAIDAFSHACEQQDIFADPSNNEGVSYLKLGVRAEASMHFDNSIHINPRNAAAWNNRGVLLYWFDRHREALACFDQAVLYERKPLILINRGFTLLAMDDLDGGLRALDESLEIEETPEAYNNKGIVLIRMNRLEDAINCFEAALHLNPEFEDARGNLERYQPEEIRAIEKKVEKPEAVQLPLRTPDEVWAQLGTITVNSLNRKKKIELQEICEALGVSTSGTKKELSERIMAAHSASNL